MNDVRIRNNQRGAWMASRSSRVLTNHDEIRRWAEERNAAPACVRRTGGSSDIGMIRLDFPGYSGEQSLEHVEWDEWFQKFDESNLALLVQDETAQAQRSNFNKIVGRETAKAGEEGNYRARRRGLKSGTARKAGSRSSSRPSGARSGSSRSASASRSSSARAKSARASSDRSDRSARTKSASSSRTRSSGASSRGRTPGGTASRGKSQRGTQSARGDVTRRSGTVAGRNRGRAGTGSRQAVASSTGRRSQKRNPEKVAKTARRIKQGADNIIRMERGQGSRGPSRVAKKPSAKSASATTRQSRAGTNARSRRRAA